MAEGAPVKQLQERPFSKTQLFCSNLPWSVNGKLLRTAFEVYGEVTDAFVAYNGRSSRGFGYVTFKDDKAASKAIIALETDGLLIDGEPERKIRVEMARERPGPRPQPGAPRPNSARDGGSSDRPQRTTPRDGESKGGGEGGRKGDGGRGGRGAGGRGGRGGGDGDGGRGRERRGRGRDGEGGGKGEGGKREASVAAELAADVAAMNMNGGAINISPAVEESSES